MVAARASLYALSRRPLSSIVEGASLIKTLYRKLHVRVGVMLLALGGLPFIVWGQEPMRRPPERRSPPSEKCTTSTPCRNVTREVVKIEESSRCNFPMGNKPIFA